jgi:hypothetical protein
MSPTIDTILKTLQTVRQVSHLGHEFVELLMDRPRGHLLMVTDIVDEHAHGRLRYQPTLVLQDAKRLLSRAQRHAVALGKAPVAREPVAGFEGAGADVGLDRLHHALVGGKTRTLRIHAASLGD